MTGNKTAATHASVDAYLSARAKGSQIEDSRRLIELFSKLTGDPPKMWGPSIVGFGSYAYTYASGRSGEAPLAGFAIRGRELVVYLDCEEESRQSLESLGHHRFTKSCLYFKQLSDIDTDILEALVQQSMNAVKRKFG